MIKKTKEVDIDEFYKNFVIPIEIKNEIDSVFLKTLKEELAKVFTNISFDTEDNWFHLEGTSGWYDSLNKSAEKTKKHEILNFYNNLKFPEYRDLFDNYFTNKAIKLGIIEENL